MVKNDKQLVTKKDLNEFGDKLEKRLDKKLDAKLSANLEIGLMRMDQKLDDKLEKWADKIYNLMDDLAVDLKNNGEHREITSHQITENTRRIEKLEKAVFCA